MDEPLFKKRPQQPTRSLLTRTPQHLDPIIMDPVIQRWHKRMDELAAARCGPSEEDNACVFLGTSDSQEDQTTITESGATRCAPSEEADACCICLGTSDSPEDRTILGCHHSFCSPCINRHFASKLAERKQPQCPLCKTPAVLDESNATAAYLCLPTDDQGSPEPVVPLQPTRAERRKFAAAARKYHWKRCPHCSAIIAKNGGCNSMTCRCGHRFKWSEVPCVCPCRQLHSHEDVAVWGSTCVGCSPIATAKLIAARGALVTVGAPLGLAACVAGFALGLTASIVPAAIFGPPALLYEPIRRMKGWGQDGKPSPLTCAAGSGLFLVGLSFYTIFGEDDD